MTIHYLGFKNACTAILLSAGLALFLFGLMPGLNIALLPVLALGLYAITEKRFWPKIAIILVWLLTLALGLFIAIYRPADFNYPLVWGTQELYEGGQSFALHTNLSKVIGGYLILVWLLPHLLRDDRRAALMPSVILATVGALTLLLSANLLFGVQWRIKIPDGLLYFIIVNLFVTVVAEEAFFRLLIQRKLSTFFSNVHIGKWFALGVTTLLFALSHTTTLGSALLLYGLAGLIYSGVFAYTNRFSVAVLIHFVVNLLHFILLEYPLPLS